MPRQDSLTEQLRTVMRMANESGCYDAADWIRTHLETTLRWGNRPAPSEQTDTEEE